MPISTEAEQQTVFDRLLDLPSFHQGGPCMKLMRCMRINDCWEFHGNEVVGARFIYRDMVKEQGGLSAENLPEDLDEGMPP